MKQCQIEIADSSVRRFLRVFLICRELQEPPRRLHSTAEVAQRHDRPFRTEAVVLFARIAHPDDQRVVEHRAVPLFHRVEPAGDVGDPFRMKLANRDTKLVPLRLLRMHVADGVAVGHHAKFLPRVVGQSRRIEVHNVRQSRRNRRRRDRTLSLEPLGRQFAVELVDHRHVGLQPVPHRRDLILPRPHLLERVEVDVELLAVHRGESLLHPFDVGANPIEQLVPRLKRLAHVPFRHAAEERLKGDVRLAEDLRPREPGVCLVGGGGHLRVGQDWRRRVLSW